MEEKILEVVSGESETVTPAFIAHRLRTDVSVVEGCLRSMARTGRLQVVTWEKLLSEGK